MKTHHLTEAECDELRSKLLAALSDAVGTHDFAGIGKALEIFDTHRSASFRNRNGLPLFIGFDPAKPGADFQQEYQCRPVFDQHPLGKRPPRIRLRTASLPTAH